jgi:hypothetical protein
VLEQLRARAAEELPTGELITKTTLFPQKDPHPPGWMWPTQSPYPDTDVEVEEFAQAKAEAKNSVIESTLEDEQDPDETPESKEAISRWKALNPDDTLKHQRRLLEAGKIDQLPWLKLTADNIAPREATSGFGITFPNNPNKGDTFVRVDQLPSVLYKFNGSEWINVDKNLTDNYTYDKAYIDHLIEKLSTGELDPELLSDGEREQVAQQLQNKSA